MAKRKVSELIVPRCEGKAFEVMKGQLFRVIAHEGKQVGDVTFLNLHNFKETFNAYVTNSAAGRCFYRASKIYSGPPFFNVMLTVTDDPVGVHFIHARCTKLVYKLVYGRGDVYYRNCQDNIAGALKPYGIEEWDVPFSTFNTFMKTQVDENGFYTFSSPDMKTGDYIEFRAEMDVLVAISACPDDTEINDFAPKPMKIEIYEEV
ncbi:MAG: urea carboxylase-associated family protein [Firmicutes bacterium]|nr:urea carboxylase-associated family protein [Bacillota bacterium]